MCLTTLVLRYCEIINIRWTFNFVYFVDRAIYEFKIPMKYVFTLDILHITRNTQNQVSTNMSNDVKPRNFVPTELNDFAVTFIACVIFPLDS